MGRRCCCNPSCKICNCSDTLIPEETKVYDFTHGKFTLSGFSDWVYDQSYSGSFSNNDFVGYPTSSWDANLVNYDILLNGTGYIRYKIAITGLSILNGEHNFYKGGDCRFSPDVSYSYLGEIVAESFFETSISGSIYTFFILPTQYKDRLGNDCNSGGAFGCPFYRPRFHSASIPPEWSGTIGTRIKLDVYVYRNNDYMPATSGNCVDHNFPIYFAFVPKETEPIATGVYVNYGKQLLSQSSDGDCTLRDGFTHCPVSACEWYTLRNNWSTCLSPFSGNIITSCDVAHKTFQDGVCWKRCIRYENHTNFLPSSNGGNLPSGILLLDTNICNTFFSLLTINSEHFLDHICRNWNGASNTITKNSDLYTNIAFGDFTESTSSDFITDMTKIYDPCGSDCSIIGTGIGFSDDNFLKSIFNYIFYYNSSATYSAPGTINSLTTGIYNRKIPVPKIVNSYWGTGFTLNTYNGYIPPWDTPTIPPSTLYQCSYTKPNIPDLSWSLVSNTVSTAEVSGILYDPYFILPEPLRISVVSEYD